MLKTMPTKSTKWKERNERKGKFAIYFGHVIAKLLPQRPSLLWQSTIVKQQTSLIEMYINIFELSAQCFETINKIIIFTFCWNDRNSNRAARRKKWPKNSVLFAIIPISFVVHYCIQDQLFPFELLFCIILCTSAAAEKKSEKKKSKSLPVMKLA